MLGGAIQLTFRRMAFDYYPFHRAGREEGIKKKRSLKNCSMIAEWTWKKETTFLKLGCLFFCRRCLQALGEVQ